MKDSYIPTWVFTVKHPQVFDDLTKVITKCVFETKN